MAGEKLGVKGFSRRRRCERCEHPWCARHGPWIGGASPLRSKLEATASRRQLHAGRASRDNPAWRREAVWGRSRRRAAAPNVSEALCRPGRSGERGTRRPKSNRDRSGIGAGSGSTSSVLTLGGLHGSAKGTPTRVSDGVRSGRPEGGNDDRPTSMQKSDLFVGAWKPVKAGGAKGEMD